MTRPRDGYSFDVDANANGFTVKVSPFSAERAALFPRCIHCLALPEFVTHQHTVVAVSYSKTLERAWFNTASLCTVQKHADELEPNDGALGDWRYDRRESLNGAVVETMTLTLTPINPEYEGRQLIWKLTDTYDESMATSYLTGFSNMRLGVWAD